MKLWTSFGTKQKSPLPAKPPPRKGAHSISQPSPAAFFSHSLEPQPQPPPPPLPTKNPSHSRSHRRRPPPTMPPKAKKDAAPAERPILGRFSSHLKIGIVSPIPPPFPTPLPSASLPLLVSCSRCGWMDLVRCGGVSDWADRAQRGCSGFGVYGPGCGRRRPCSSDDLGGL